MGSSNTPSREVTVGDRMVRLCSFESLPPGNSAWVVPGRGFPQHCPLLFSRPLSFRFPPTPAWSADRAPFLESAGDAVNRFVTTSCWSSGSEKSARTTTIQSWPFKLYRSHLFVSSQSPPSRRRKTGWTGRPIRTGLFIPPKRRARGRLGWFGLLRGGRPRVFAFNFGLRRGFHPPQEAKSPSRDMPSRHLGSLLFISTLLYVSGRPGCSRGIVAVRQN